MRRSVDHARHYLSGLLGTQRRKNMETIEGDVQGADYQGIEQFISSSPWDHDPLLDQQNLEVDGLLGGHPDSCLIIDETSFIKKGNRSVGVKRQYSGRAGKVENCQVGVFVGLGCGNRACLTDFRLFLPEDWAADEQRLTKAKVPQEHRVHKTKHALALEMVAAARSRGLRYNWVGADSLYGTSAAFLNALEDAGERFVADINRVTKVWTQEPHFADSAPTGRGRKALHPRLSPDYTGRYLTVESLCAQEFDTGQQQICYRNGTAGPLRARVWVREVWTWEKTWPEPRARLLIISQSRDGKFKYSLSNCLELKDNWQRLCYMQHQRFFIEHAFHEAKGQLGMAQYQVRVWRGWHHHMALVCLAMLFTLREQLLQARSMPLLSLRDLTELLDHYLPRKATAEKEILRQIQKRHRTRQQDIHRRNNRAREKVATLTK